MTDVFSILKKAKHEYKDQTIEVVEGYEFSQYETLRKADLYVNSIFTSGRKDGLGRDKPFYNISKHRLNVAIRATDLDTKDVQIKASRKADYWKSFALTLKNKEWMKKSNFATFLNKVNEARAKYGTGLAKKVMDKGNLSIEVVPWLDLIVDPVDIFTSPIIQRHYFSPSGLRKMKSAGWDAEAIEDIISDSETHGRDAHAAQDDAGQNESNSHLIEIYELHAELPTYLLDEDDQDEDDTLTVPQMHILYERSGGNDEDVAHALFSGEQDEIPYKAVDWDKQDGRSLGVGVMEDLFESQIWTNYTTKQTKDMIDMSSKIIFQKHIDSDLEVDITNVLTEMETGDVLEAQIQQVNNTPTSFPSLSNILQSWDEQATRVSSTFEAKTGETLPSGTPFRSVAIQNQEANSYFSYKREQFGLFVKELYRDWIIPQLIKELEEDSKFAIDLELSELKVIDTAYAKRKANEQIIESILSGKFVTQDQYDVLQEGIMETLQENGSRRFFESASDFFDGDGAYEIDIIVTGEEQNKAAVLESINTALTTVANGQRPDGTNIFLDDPRMAQLFNQLLEIDGNISPISLGSSTRQKPKDVLQLPDINNNQIK